MKTYIGIDLGGTNIKGALVTEEGTILRRSSLPTGREQGAEAVTRDMAEMIRQLAREQAPEGVGIGCPGTVDDRAGRVLYACNLGWERYDLRGALRELTGYSPRLVNDANAAALAEALAGAAKGAESAVVVTLGTGVGGGVVLGGRLLKGYSGCASELGHMVIEEGGQLCACGRRGCFETCASATALIRMTREAMGRCPDSGLHAVAAKMGGVDGRTAFLAREAGDPAAEEVVSRYIHYLAVGIGNIVNIFFPEVVVLAGGISGQGEGLLAPLRQEVARMEYGAAYSHRHPRLVCSGLGGDAGIIGAALFAREK